MLQSEFASALNQVASERGVSPEAVINTIKEAMVSAYRKEYEIEPEKAENIEVIIDSESGETKLMLLGKDITPSGFGRIAAQTAKQVILQKINEAEKEAIINEYRQKLGSIVSGTVFRMERGVVIVDLGKAHGIMPPAEQIPGEHFPIGRRIRSLLKEIQDTDRGAEVILSRSAPDFVSELFALEVPEISAGTVKIEGVAREAGLRSKVAVSANVERVDPVGSCVGQKGVRVQAVMDELGEERIDIIPYDPFITNYISNALSPAKVREVVVTEKEKQATVEVVEDQLSLAIGKGGQNVRLAAKLTGWKIDVKGAELLDAKEIGADLGKIALPSRVEKALIAAGIVTIATLATLSDEELREVKGLGPRAIRDIKEALTRFKDLPDEVESTNEESKESLLEVSAPETAPNQSLVKALPETELENPQTVSTGDDLAPQKEKETDPEIEAHPEVTVTTAEAALEQPVAHQQVIEETTAENAEA